MMDYKEFLPQNPKEEYEKNYQKLREQSLITIYYHAYYKSRSYDIAGDVFLEADLVIDRLLARYFHKEDSNYLLHYLLSISNYLLLAHRKEMNSKRKRENAVLCYSKHFHKLYSIPSGDSNGKNQWEEYQKALLQSVRGLQSELKYILCMKFDLDLGKEFHKEFQHYLIQRKIQPFLLLAEHEKRRLQFYKTKAKLLQKIGYYTSQILTSKDSQDRTRWKQRKAKTLRSLEKLVEKGLYNNWELSLLFGIPNSTLSKKIRRFCSGQLQEKSIGRPRKDNRMAA